MAQAKKGNLKIFFGYAESIGKTLAMLKAAQRAKSQGVDVLVGYVSPHTSKEALDLLEGLECLGPPATTAPGEFALDHGKCREY